MNLSQTEIVRLDMPASYKHLKILSACIAELLECVLELNNRDVQTYNVQLAAHEICTNIVDHAYGGNDRGRIAVTLSLVPKPLQIIIDFQDTGSAFDPSIVPEPDLTEAHEHGYGLFLARSLMDKVSYRSQAGSNYWSLIKYL